MNRFFLLSGFSRRFLSLASLLCLVCISFSGVLSAQESTLQPSAKNLSDIQWGEAGGGNGFPVGVRSARQVTDPATGGFTYYALFPAGSHFDLHWHTHNEHVVVVQGTVTIVLDDTPHTVSTGGYIVLPGKLNHSWDVPAGGEDVIIVVRREGPADFHFVEQ
ncbi:MAG: cupin domain-containing protein [Gammaproteobacteria bacterium]|jgi:quercetin dioxygenase-like cupin family protein|nr:cupin domain-containing protein [Gammaproteobacteria bacterium]MBT3861019.1 cupin domain-containing protein [Gammaproteobacteria bacterium]MBT3987807.1 cupin domain-containing protein [Gammaproteobacteria bacterium]MBT4581546.1 cupin domain-containing protein [Gammaproteobacteria bacterium]MBT4659823.1 cupin domain-containing protein [Gammaproteobacteria bacterium]